MAFGGRLRTVPLNASGKACWTGCRADCSVTGGAAGTMGADGVPTLTAIVTGRAGTEMMTGPRMAAATTAVVDMMAAVVMTAAVADMMAVAAAVVMTVAAAVMAAEG